MFRVGSCYSYDFPDWCYLCVPYYYSYVYWFSYSRSSYYVSSVLAYLFYSSYWFDSCFSLSYSYYYVSCCSYHCYPYRLVGLFVLCVLLLCVFIIMISIVVACSSYIVYYYYDYLCVLFGTVSCYVFLSVFL